MLNRIILMGRLVREPELRYTSANVPVCTITLAVERDFVRRGEQREADFLDVVCWRHHAEFVAKYFRKGQMMAVDGRLQGRRWKDRLEQNRISFEVIAENVYFAEKAEKAAQPAGYDEIMQAYRDAQSGATPESAPEKTGRSWLEYNEPELTGSEFAPLGDDDVPF